MNTYEPKGQISIVGNVGQPPILRTTSGDNPRPVCNFTVAGPSKFVVDEHGASMQPEWYRVVAFDDLAKYVAENVTKSMKVGVAGTHQTATSTREEDGRVFVNEEIVLSNINLKGELIALPEPMTDEIDTTEAEAQKVIDEVLAK